MVVLALSSLAYAQSSPGAASAGATNSPPNGNYPGSGSSITNSTPPGAPPTPGSGNQGARRTPPDGVTPGTGTSPDPVK